MVPPFKRCRAMSDMDAEKRVAQVLKDRKRYEDEVQEKENAIPTLSAASFKISNDRDLLECSHFLGHFGTLALDVDLNDLTSTHMTEYFEGIIKGFKRKRGDPCCD